jgi:D-alanyl-D-alanine carboxypeptidase
MAPIAPRHRRTVLAGVAVLATAALASVVGCSTGSDERRLAGPTADRLDAVLASAVDDPATPLVGAAIAVDHEELGTWAGAAGEADASSRRPLTPADRIRGGSILKPFVATVVLQLVEEGAFGLDDAITTLLPADVTDRFPTAEGITVRMLLNHTSGLAEYNDPSFKLQVHADPRRVWSAGDLLDLAAAKPNAGAPGERYAYANTNYNLLGLVIEGATGRPWRTAVRERVIEHLDLDDTSLPEPGRPVDGDDVAHGYQAVGGELVDLTGIDASMADAAGGHALLTTDADLLRFLDALLAGDLFDDDATLDAMLTFVDADEPTGKNGQGLGVERYRLPDGRVIVGHLGGTAGYLSLMGRVVGSGLDLAMTITTAGDPLVVLVPALDLLAPVD